MYYMCIYIRSIFYEEVQILKIKKYARTCVYDINYFPIMYALVKHLYIPQTTHLHMEPLPAPLIIQPVTRQISRR